MRLATRFRTQWWGVGGRDTIKLVGLRKTCLMLAIQNRPSLYFFKELLEFGLGCQPSTQNMIKNWPKEIKLLETNKKKNRN